MVHLPLKFKALFLFLLAISSAISEAQESCDTLAKVELKTGYFFFSDSKMQKIYDRGGFDVQLCVSSPLLYLTNKWILNGYGAVEYFQRSGHSTNGHQKTSIWSTPVNIGLQPVYVINADTQYYFAIGPRYLYLHQHNDSSYVDRTNSRNSWGFFVNTGFNYVLCDHFVIDIFGEYTYAKAHFHSRKSNVYTKSVQVGGFTFGVGTGYEF